MVKPGFLASWRQRQVRNGRFVLAYVSIPSGKKASDAVGIIDFPQFLLPWNSSLNQVGRDEFSGSPFS
jgi:hypothetical protein